MAKKKGKRIGMNMAAMIRYETIDKCLRNKYATYTWKDLAEACAEALNEIEEKDIPSERTIRGDIKRMQSGILGYQAPIQNFRTDPLKPGYYKYTDPDFSIHKYSITKDQVQSLQECLDLIRHFKEFQFQGHAVSTIQSLIHEILPGANINDLPIVGFDKVENAQGLELIDEFYQAIRDQLVLKFQFHPFRKEPIQYLEEVHPYYLHQYNNRWFLFAYCKRKNKENGIYKFGLERIKKVVYLKENKFIENTSFNPAAYFADIIGVSYPKNEEKKEIILSFTPEKGKYVKSKPIHASQKIIQENIKECIISLQLKINYELVREIISFMGDVKVLAPALLIDRVQKELHKTLDRYQNTEDKRQLSKAVISQEADFERISEEFQGSK